MSNAWMSVKEKRRFRDWHVIVDMKKARAARAEGDIESAQLFVQAARDALHRYVRTLRSAPRCKRCNTYGAVFRISNRTEHVVSASPLYCHHCIEQCLNKARIKRRGACTTCGRGYRYSFEKNLGRCNACDKTFRKSTEAANRLGIFLKEYYYEWERYDRQRRKEKEQAIANGLRNAARAIALVALANVRDYVPSAAEEAAENSKWMFANFFPF